MVQELSDLCKRQFTGKRIQAWGLTFKPNIDGMRDAPSLKFMPALVDSGATVIVFDSEGFREGEGLLPGTRWHEVSYDAAENAGLLILLTEWTELCARELKRLAGLVRHKRMADLRNIYSAKVTRKSEFDVYDCIVRMSVEQ